MTIPGQFLWIGCQENHSGVATYRAAGREVTVRLETFADAQALADFITDAKEAARRAAFQDVNRAVANLASKKEGWMA